MITVKETLGVSADSFIQQILTSAIYDIKQAADKNLTEQQLHKGYQYTKKMRSKLGSSGDVKVKITELDAPRVYAAEFTCATGKNMISYVIESLEQEKITVTYTEDFSGKSASHNLNYKVVGALYKRRAKKKWRVCFITWNPISDKDHQRNRCWPIRRSDYGTRNLNLSRTF